MSKLRIVPVDDTVQTAIALKQAVFNRFANRTIDEKSTSLWFLALEGYNWTMEDADFMNDLAHKQDLLAGWNYQAR